MANNYIPYFLHSVFLNDSRLGGVQSVTISKDYDTTAIVKYGSPQTVKNFYKKPNVSITTSKFITSGLGPSIPSFSLSDYIENAVGTYPSYKLTVKIIDQSVSSSDPGYGRNGAGGFEFKDMLVSSISYNYDVQGFFTEDITYVGHISNLNSGFIGKFTVRTENDTGEVYRRKDFAGITLPNIIPTNSVLQSVNASLNISYGDVPTWGNFYTLKSKYIAFPVDISCEINILNLGYKQDSDGFSLLDGSNVIDDSVSEYSISISGPPTVNIGSKNFLTSMNANGGDAGSSDYSTITYNFKNNNNSFSIS